MRYLQAGVREYWIVDPEDQSVSVHLLKNSEYVIYAYGSDESVPVHVLEECIIDLPDVFAE